MHIALDRRHDNDAVRTHRARLFALDERHQMRHGLLHDARTLHYLRQEHLAGAKQIADDVHAVHQRAFDHLDRVIRCKPRRFGVFGNEFIQTLDQRMLQTLGDRPGAPFQIHYLFGSTVALESAGDIQQALGGINTPIQNDIFDRFAKLRLNLLVNRELPRIDDAHVHTGLDGVIQEHAVHGLTHRIVATERKRHIADATAHHRVRQLRLDQTGGFDKRQPIAVVFLDACSHRKNVRIENNIFGREANLLGQNLVGARTDRNLALDAIGLTLLVERHDHHRRTITPHFLRLRDEGRFAFLHAD